MNGFAVAAGEGQARWFVNTLTMNKAAATNTRVGSAGRRWSPLPASWATRWGRCSPWRGWRWLRRPPTTQTRQCDWPGRPIKSRVSRSTLTGALIQAGGFAAAERVRATALAASRDAGDLASLPELLARTMLLDLRASRAGHAATHLRESRT
jgi:hypothetical protein